MARVEELARVRRLVAEAATAAGLAPNRLGQLLVSVNEITTNALTHGTSPATVTVTVTDGVIVVAVRDRGGGLSHDSLVASRPTPDSVRGRGLWLATRLADGIGLTTDSSGTTVTVTMRVDP